MTTVAHTQPIARNNFRPVAYSTQQELEAFFGYTSGQKRELYLRMRDEDGRIWFDAAEREEWRALLQTTPRRGSAETFALDSPRRGSLCAPAVSEASTPGPSFSFPDTILEEEGRRYRPARPHNNTVHELLDTYTFEEQSQEGIYIPRLPLARRKATPALLDEAFTPDTKARPPPLNLNAGKRKRPHSVIGLSPPPTCAGISYNLTQPGNRGTFGGNIEIDVQAVSPMQEVLESPQPVSESFVDLQPKRAVKFTASLTSLRSNFTELESGSASTAEAFTTRLAPRIGARKASPPPPTIKEPVAETAMGGRYKISAGLRTGEEVYQGVEIPCASIYLESDESEDDASVAHSETSNGSGGNKKKGGKVKKWFTNIVAK